MHRVTLNASALTSLGQRPRSLAERGYEGSRGLQSTEESDVVARRGATAEPPSNIQHPTSTIQHPTPGESDPDQRVSTPLQRSAFPSPQMAGLRPRRPRR